jgi:exopolyphosphatase/pppGpp-phosphohydrolase
MRRAVIEVGTSALRAAVVETAPEGDPRVVAEHRVVLRLERAVRRDGVVGRGRLELLGETLRRAREAVLRAGADDVTAVVAAALDRAGDLAALEAAVAATLDVPPVVRSRAREAELALLAGHPGGLHGCVVDLGDDELRLFHGRDGALDRGAVLDLGIDVLRPPVGSDLGERWVAERIRREVTRCLGRLPPPGAGGRTVRWPVLVGSSARLLADVAGDRLDGGTLAALAGSLVGTSPTGRLLLPAVDPARVDELALVVLALVAVVEALAAGGLAVTPRDAWDGELLLASRPAVRTTAARAG